MLDTRALLDIFFHLYIVFSRFEVMEDDCNWLSLAFLLILGNMRPMKGYRCLSTFQLGGQVIQTQCTRVKSMHMRKTRMDARFQKMKNFSLNGLLVRIAWV